MEFNERTPLVESHKTNSGKFTVRSFKLSKGTTLSTAIAYASVSMLSTGFFIAPSMVLRETHSGWTALFVWFVATLIVLAGSVALCELGCQMPVSGGVLVYIQSIYGDMAHFASYIILGVLFLPLSTTITALTFGVYMQSTFASDSCYGDWVARLFSFTLVGVVAIVNAKGIRMAFAVQKFIFASQAFMVMFIVAVGIYKFILNEMPDQVKSSFEFPKINFLFVESCALGLYAALYAADGWENIFSLAGELDNPKSSIVITSIVSVAMVLASYAAVTIMHLSSLSLAQVSATDAPLALFMTSAVHEYASYALLPFIYLTCLGGVNSCYVAITMYTIASAKAGAIPRVFGMVNATYRSAMIPIVMLTVLVLVLLLPPVSALQRMVNAAIFFMWILNTACFLGILILRYKFPLLNRPFQVWLPVPIMLVVAGTFMLASLALKEPYDFVVYIVIGLLPLAVYRWNETRCAASFRCSSLSNALHIAAVKCFNLAEV